MKTISLLKEARARLKPSYKHFIVSILIVTAISITAGLICFTLSFEQIESLAATKSFVFSDFIGVFTIIFTISLIAEIFLLLLGQGILAMSLKIARREQVSSGMVFSRLKDWKRIILLSIVEGLLILLWALLIIPAWIKIFSYSQSCFILLEDENIGVIDAITKSRKMMDGHKFKLFRIFIFIFLIMLVAEIILIYTLTISMALFIVAVILLALIITFCLAPLLSVVFAIFHLSVAGDNAPVIQ